jgi:hypothetical protein
MADNNENLNSLNQEKTTLEEELKTLDSENDKEKISEISEKVNSLNDEIKTLEEGGDDDLETLKERNKRLFERAKKAEGFERGEDGKWVKKPKPITEIKPKVIEKVVTDESVINKVLDKRELESLDMSDTLKKEIETYANLKGISVKKALKSDYISFLVEKEEKDKKIDNASLGSGRRGVKKDYENMKSTDFDMRTPEGKAEFAKWEDYTRKKLG